MARVGIIGNTTWGTTLGVILSNHNLDVLIWCRSEQEAVRLNKHRENKRFLPKVLFPDKLQATSSKQSLSKSDLVLLAIPSGSLRSNINSIKDFLKEETIVMTASKGLELDSGKRMTEILEEELPVNLKGNICALSGPNLAIEIAADKPSSAVIASENQEVAYKAQQFINTKLFRTYTTNDVIGVELGGALKNIISLGAGICDGLGLGDNSKAAFMTRGLAEITRLGIAAGAEASTFAGLAGMGDLIATCYSNLSRNHKVGVKLSQGLDINKIRSSMNNVIEGIDTTMAATNLAKKLGVEMPITFITYKVLFEGLSIDQAIFELMGRPPRTE